MRYRSRPQDIEAVQWTGDNFGALHEFVGDRVEIHDVAGRLRLLAGVDGVQGWVDVPVEHWIVHMPNDVRDIWPVDPEYFANKYELLDDQT